jgi:hypothetical protein
MRASLLVLLLLGCDAPIDRPAPPDMIAVTECAYPATFRADCGGCVIAPAYCWDRPCGDCSQEGAFCSFFESTHICSQGKWRCYETLGRPCSRDGG